MASSYPGALDSFTNPTGANSLSDVVGGRTHAQMHADINDAVEAIEGALGTNPGFLAANVQTADYTAVLSDAGKVIELNKATGIAVTIPPSSSVAWPAGTVINVYQAGVGNATITPGAGVTIRNLAALRGQYAEASLRYRGSNEWVLEGDLASASAPALKDYAEVLRTAGSLNLPSTAVAAVSTALDLNIAAAAGDLVEYGISGLLSAAASDYCFDVYTVPSTSPVAPFSVGLNVATGLQGVTGWEITNAESHASRLQGSITRVLDAGDVASGATTLRLYYFKGGGTTRDLYAVGTIPLKVWVKNYGQV